MASKALHAAWRRSILWCWMDKHRDDESSGIVAHALATFPRRMQKAPDLQRVRLQTFVCVRGAYPQSWISIHRCYKL
jgi:hypothetical protein